MYYVKLYIVFLLISCMTAHYNSLHIYNYKNSTFVKHPHIFSVTCAIYANLFVQFSIWVGHVVVSTISHTHDLISTLFGGAAMLLVNHQLSKNQEDYKVDEKEMVNENRTWVNYNYQRKIKLSQNIGVVMVLDYVVTAFVCQDRRRCAE